MFSHLLLLLSSYCVLTNIVKKTGRTKPSCLPLSPLSSLSQIFTQLPAVFTVHCSAPSSPLSLLCRCHLRFARHSLRCHLRFARHSLRVICAARVITLRCHMRCARHLLSFSANALSLFVIDEEWLFYLGALCFLSLLYFRPKIQVSSPLYVVVWQQISGFLFRFCKEWSIWGRGTFLFHNNH